MLTTVYYFLQVVLCSGVMMGYYWLVLRNKRFHQYNRFYLLVIAVLSWIVPLIKIRWSHAVASEDPQMIRFLSVVADNNSQIDESLTNHWFEWNWDTAATLIYIIVASILLAGMVQAFFRLYRLLKEHSCKNVGDVHLILTQAKGTPFSFFSYVFWNEQIDIHSEAGKQILQHELTHVQQKHSVDKVLIQVMLVVGWFNPFFWLLKKEMDMIHEFIADKKAVHNGDTASLAQMLLTAAYPQQQFALANPFFFSPIKRRLQMLTNNKNPRFTYIRRLIVLPLLAVVVVLFAFRSEEQRVHLTLSVGSVVENVADAISSNVSESAKQDNISVSDNSMPASNTNDLMKVRTLAYQQRTSSGLQGVNNYLSKTGINKTDTVIIKLDEQSKLIKNPLFILDGKKTDSNVLHTLNPDQIREVQILKNESATNLYGEEGKEGVVLITSKQYAEQEHQKKFPITALTISGTEFDKYGHISASHPDSLNLEAVAITSFDDNKNSGIKAFRTRNPEIKEVYWYLKPLKMRVALKDGTEETYDLEKPDSKKRAENKYGKLPATPTQPSMGKQTSKSDIKIENVMLQLEPVNDKHLIKEEVVQTPPEFPGGLAAWTKYLERNLNKNIVKKNGGPPGKYTVLLSFMVDKDGNVSNIQGKNDPGYGAKGEAMRIIAKGPNWKPAIQNGKRINSFHQLSITFFVPESIAKSKVVGIDLGKFTNPAIGNSEKISAEEKIYEMKLVKAKAQNLKTFFTIDGSSCVVTESARASIDGITDIVIVDGKQMTPAELNSKYKRSDFVLVAASDTKQTIKKFGKSVLLVSSKKLPIKDINKLLF